MHNNMLLQSTAAVGKELLQHPILATLTAIGMLIFQYGFGSSKVVLITFILFVILLVMDWLSGTSAAKKDGIDASRYGIDGAKNLAIVVTLPVIGRLIDIMMGTEVIVMGVIVGVLARSVARSVIANVKRAGWNIHIPDTILKWVEDELLQKDARAVERLKNIKTGATKNDEKN